MENSNKHTYFVEGMHCASCEVLIQSKLAKEKGVKNVVANTNDGKVEIETEGNKIELSKLNEMFKDFHYTFSATKPQKSNKNTALNIMIGLSVALILVTLYTKVDQIQIQELYKINVDEKSTILGFMLFGLLAGFSTCGALTGSLILSITKSKAGSKNLIQFNVGRLVTFAILGAVLGSLGTVLKISDNFRVIVTAVVIIFMLYMGLQMLGVSFLKSIAIFPKFFGGLFNKVGNRFPAILGALTFFLPCGFTLTAQTLAITSGDALKGATIMIAFALGTLPALLIIGITSTELKRSSIFGKIAGVLIIAAALFNLSNLINLIELPANNPKLYDKTNVTNTNAQVIKMNATAGSYEPNYFKVKVNVPVRWEVTDKGMSGCTSAIIARGLLTERFPLKKGGTAVVEFTPTKVGTYRFSCWMGMVTGNIEVVN